MKLSNYQRLFIFTCIFFVTMQTCMAEAKGFDPFAGNQSTTRNHARNVIASLEFVDTPITTVFRMISDLTGWSIIMSPEVSKRPPRINIWIKNLTPQQVLDQVATLGELAIERKGSTIKVMNFEEYSRIYGVEKRVVVLKYANATEIAKILKPFVAKEDQARVLPDEGGNKIVLLVPKPLIESLVKLIEAIDIPYERDIVRIVQLKHLEATILVPMLEDFLTKQAKGAGRTTRSKSGAPKTAVGFQLTRAGDSWLVNFMVESKLNVIVLRGLAKEVEQTRELITKLDISTDIKVKSYELQYTNAQETFDTLKEIVREEQRMRGRSRHGVIPRLRLSVSEQNNRIIVEGSPKDQKRLSKIIAAIDQPLPAGTGGMRVYRLENTSADEVAKVLNDLVADKARGGRDRLARQKKSSKGNSNKDKSAGDDQPTAGDILPPRISVAPEINAVIIRASSTEHEEFTQVIRELDKPRDQVVLEVTLVTVRSDKTLDIGIDVGFGSRDLGSGGGVHTGFATFGVGAVDAQTGAVKMGAPALGLNYSIFNLQDLSLVIKALQTVGDVRIASIPKILVEDNAQASISQYNQEPYEVANQGGESTITSFGGFVDAGTSMVVRPHIAEAGWLRLQYSISLSSFGTRNSQQEIANLPPPRRETQTSGTVRIPEEHIVVLGGIKSTREDASEDSVPWLSDIPWLGELFKNRSRSKIHETLYIFIRPIVLRDPKFRDLLYLSEIDIKSAKLDNVRYPANPLKMFMSIATKKENANNEDTQ